MSDLLRFCLWIYPVLFGFYLPIKTKSKPDMELASVDNIVATIFAAAWCDFLIYCVITAIQIAWRHG